MPGGTEFTEAQELSKEIPEVAEAKQQLDRATIEPEAAVEKSSEFKPAEDLLKEVVSVVEAAPKLETPPAITLEAAGEASKVTIEAADTVADGEPKTEDREVIIDSNDGVSAEAIIDSNDDPTSVSAAERSDTVGIIDSNDGTSSEAIIDSNDGVSAEAIIDSNDGTSRVSDEEPVQDMVGDSHLMEEEEKPVQSRTASDQTMEEEDEPVQGKTGASLVMEEEEPVQGLINQEVVPQIMNQLPDGAETFSNQAAADIVQLVRTDNSADYISQTEKYIHGQYKNISKDQVDGLMAVTLLKAAQELDADRAEDLGRPPDPGMGDGISPNLPGTNPGASASAGDSPGGNLQTAEINTESGSEIDAKKVQEVAGVIDMTNEHGRSARDMWKDALRLLKEVNERQQQNADKMTT